MCSQGLRSVVLSRGKLLIFMNLCEKRVLFLRCCNLSTRLIQSLSHLLQLRLELSVFSAFLCVELSAILAGTLSTHFSDLLLSRSEVVVPDEIAMLLLQAGKRAEVALLLGSELVVLLVESSGERLR